jgi:putative radical SAM enzyme (TIGR03279 family)
VVTVYGIAPGSIADRKGIMVGDKLHTVNGNEISDVLDYRFYLTDSRVKLTLERDGVFYETEILKEMYADIGLEFETYLMDNKRSCQNRCIFCFIDQNPCGMRETLYFKDDDSRLSFLMGNYVTLTNLKDSDIDRIIKMHMSPINVSVHTTNPELRCKMMKNRFAGQSLGYLKRLADAGITINGQIVLCKGLNDKDELSRTMSELYALYPAISSVSVVPAGLTKHREGLYPLELFTPEEAAEVIAQVNSFGDKCKNECGSRIFCCADEFYLKSKIPFPDASYYEDYPQFENGVGMIVSMLEEFSDELEFLEEDYDTSLEKKFSIATGEAAFDFISSLSERLCEKCPSLRGNVYKIENNFFGNTITVAGLICGCDLIDQLRGKELGDTLYISSNMLRAEGDLFLDSISLEDAEKELNVKIIPVPTDGYEFIKAILEK